MYYLMYHITWNTTHNIDFPQLVTNVSSYGIEMEDPYTRTRKLLNVILKTHLAA